MSAPVFKVPALPSQSLPQDIALLVEMGVVDEPKAVEVELDEVVSPGKADAGDVEAMLLGGEDNVMEEGEFVDEDVKEEVVLPAGGAVAVAAEEEEEGSESGEESDSSSSSSTSSGSSTSSAPSTASAALGRPPSVPNVKAHKRHLREVAALENEESDAGSEPDMNEDMFRSANELPQPSQAPPLPFTHVPFGSQLKELGTIMSAVGKQIVISSKPATMLVGVGAGRKEVVVEPEALAEGSVVCWSDGRVLGLVHDTFGPLTNPLYTLLLPDNFAQPKVLATTYPSLTLAASSTPVVSDAVVSTSSASANGTADEPSQSEEPVEAAGNPGVNVFTIEMSEDGIRSLVDSNLIRVVSPPTSPAPILSGTSPSKPVVPLPLVASSSKEASGFSLPSPSTQTKPDSNLTWLPTIKDSVTQFVEAASLSASQLVGLSVFFPSTMGTFVPTARLKREKWTDASNKFDEEAGEEEMEWSDDEEEMLAKKRRKMARGSSRAASSVRGGSPAPSDVGSSYPNFPKQHSDFAPPVAASSYARSAYGGDGSDEDEGMLDYDGQTDGGELPVPERTMPAAYEEWGAGQAPTVADADGLELGEEASSSSRVGAERGGRGRGRGERGRGRGGERGGRGGDRDVGKGGRGGDRESGRGRGERGRGRGDRGRGDRAERGRGRGGRDDRGSTRGDERVPNPPPRMSDDRPPYVSAPLPAPPQMPQGMHYQPNGALPYPSQHDHLLSTQRNGGPAPLSQPARPMSPTSAAIARATGQYFPPQQQQQHTPMSVSPMNGNGHAYPSPNGANIPYNQQQYNSPPPPHPQPHYNPQGPPSIPSRPPPTGPAGLPAPPVNGHAHYQPYTPQPYSPSPYQRPPPLSSNGGHSNPMFQQHHQPYLQQHPNGFSHAYGLQQNAYASSSSHQQSGFQNGYPPQQLQGYANPAFGGGGPSSHPDPSTPSSVVELALQRQKAEHEKEMVAMKRQIALLSRGRKPDSPGGGPLPPAAGQGGGWVSGLGGAGGGAY